MVAIDSSKQQALDADPKAIQQSNFTGNITRKDNQGRNINDNTTMFSIIEEAKETTLDFPQDLWKYCEFLKI